MCARKKKSLIYYCVHPAKGSGKKGCVYMQKHERESWWTVFAGVGETYVLQVHNKLMIRRGRTENQKGIG